MAKEKITELNEIVTMYLDYAESEFEKYIDSLLQSDKDCDWKYIKQEHLTQVAFFQHERLVHLIVTIAFAILELLTVCAYVVVGAIDSALSMPLLVLAIAILILRSIHQTLLSA